MKSIYLVDEWLVEEEDFHPDLNRESESIFSIGNGYMGLRANFEERYSGDSLLGSYVAGVHYPGKTPVGWWKNGFPEYFARVPSAPKWIGIDITINEKPLDLASAKIHSFRRTLNMKEGWLERTFSVSAGKNRKLEFSVRRFVSMAEPDAGVIKFSVHSEDFDGSLGFSIYLDSDVRNEDANYGKKFWKETGRRIDEDAGILIAATHKTDFHVATAMSFEIHSGRKPVNGIASQVSREKYVAYNAALKIAPGQTITIYKYVSVISSLNNQKEKLMEDVYERVGEIKRKGFDRLFAEHKAEWARIWAEADVTIEGDVAAKQAIRFNIFHLNQTCTGNERRK